MPSLSNADKARQIIASNHYLTLATANASGNPWVAPLYYAYDSAFNFYFISAAGSLHAQHIAENKRVAWAIFDSHDPVGKGDGVQFSGLAHQLGLTELPRAIQIYFKRRVSDEPSRTSQWPTPVDFTYAARLRVFRLRPVEVFTLDVAIDDIATRVPVDLSEGCH